MRREFRRHHRDLKKVLYDVMDFNDARAQLFDVSGSMPVPDVWKRQPNH